MKSLSSFGMLLARVCLSTIFIFAGVGKFLDYQGTEQYMLAKGMVLTPFFLISAAILEVVAGFLLLIGYQTRLAAGALALFLIPTTFIFHSFWDIPVELQNLQMIMFLKNLAIFGGLLSIVCQGPGNCALDRPCSTKD